MVLKLQYSKGKQNIIGNINIAPYTFIKYSLFSGDTSTEKNMAAEAKIHMKNVIFLATFMHSQKKALSPQ